MKLAMAAGVLLLSTAVPVQACRPFFPGFSELVSQSSSEAIVIGHYIPETNGEVPAKASNLFVVDEVLAGPLKAGTYRLMMTGPWGNSCETSTMADREFPTSETNPVVLLVARQIDGSHLDLPFGEAQTQISNGRLTSQRRYVDTRSGRRYLKKPRVLSVSVAAFRTWLARVAQ